jgi:ribosome-associated translation inhibitor RaiA
MRMAIHSQHRVNHHLRESIERRVRFVLARFGNRVGHVAIFLSDQNRGHGNAAKQCKIIVHLTRKGEVCVENSDGDLQVVVNRATGRIGQSVQRALERCRDARAFAKPLG